MLQNSSRQAQQLREQTRAHRELEQTIRQKISPNHYSEALNRRSKHYTENGNYFFYLEWLRKLIASILTNKKKKRNRTFK